MRLDTLLIIFSLLLISRLIELSGLMNRIAIYLFKLFKGNTIHIIVSIIILILLSSAIIMNDTAIFIYIPLVSVVAKLSNLKKSIIVTLSCIAANIGSSLTPIGNPQNIIIWIHYRLSFIEFTLFMAPIVTILSLLLIVYSIILLRTSGMRKYGIMPIVKLSKLYAMTAIILLVLDITLIQKGLYLYAFIITLLVTGLARYKILLEIDYALIAIFTLMFIDFTELSSLVFKNIIMQVNNGFSLLFYGISICQVISNVPATIVLTQHINNWKVLALSMNIGGLGLIHSSMANFIGIRLSRISIWDFHRYCLPFFILSLVVLSLFIMLGLYSI